MANKKTAKKIAAGKTSPGKAVPQSGSEAPASGAAFAMGLTALSSFGLLFLPLYSAGEDVVHGFDFLIRPGALPKAIVENFDLFPGPALFLLLAGTALAQAVIGFGWSRLPSEKRGTVATILAVVAVGAILGGHILHLGLLDMNVIKHTQVTGLWVSALLILSGLLGIRLCAAVDAEEGREDAALAPGDWAIWLGGLTATAFIHYSFVCYKLVLKAPEALVSKLRTFR